MNKPRARGRPRGPSTAKADILAAAQRRFSEAGYARVSMRSIAAEAGVDPALISYHFGSKRGLFGAAMSLSVNPAEAVDLVLDGPRDTLAERLLRTVVAVWDDAGHRTPLLRMLEGAMSDPESNRLFREMVESELLARIAASLGGGSANRVSQRQATAMAGQIGGLILMRYLIRVEPVASMTVDDVVATFTPGLRAVIVERG